MCGPFFPGPCPTNKKLSGKSGTIQSPNFPNNYEVEHDCSWIISVPRGYHVLLSFNRTDFHIHSCNKICDCDFLEVRAGTTAGGMLLGKFCGSDPPSPIYVNGNDMWLRFVSNKLSNNKGFRAKFEAIRPLKGMLSLEMQMITLWLWLWGLLQFQLAVPFQGETTLQVQ